MKDHNWPREEAALIKSMWNGTADTASQQRVIRYIVEVLGGINAETFDENNSRLTDFNCGRRWVARQIQHAITIPIDQLTKEDSHERGTARPKSATERARENNSKRTASSRSRKT